MVARRVRPLLAGWRLRCPACGEGRMSPTWRSFLTMNETCASCGIPFVPGRGESVGGVELATYATAVVGLVGFLVLLLVVAVPWWLQLAWVVGFGALAPLLTYRHFRGVWVGAMYLFEPWGVGGHAPHVAPVATASLPWDD